MRRNLLALCALVALLGAGGAEAEIRFQEVSAATGTSAQHDNLGHSAAGEYSQTLFGSGVAFEDLNKDGWPDLLLGNGAAGKKVFLNNGDGTFEDRSNWLARLPSTTSAGVAVADFQNDGSLDVSMPNYFHEPFLFRGNGNSLSQLASQYGVSPLMFSQGEEPDFWYGPNSMGTAFGDVNGDGYVELYVANYQPNMTDIFFRSHDGGYFVRSDDIKVESSRLSAGFQPVFVDLDDDGDLDIYVSNDFASNFYFENQNRLTYRFVEKSRNYKINGGVTPLSNDNVMSMGVAVGDFDNDLDFDIYVTNYLKNALYVNPDGPGVNTTFFAEAAAAHGVQYQLNCWGTGFFDADNDGDLDLALVGGWTLSQPVLDQGKEIDNRFYRNDGAPDYKFSEITAQAGFTDTQAGRSFALADYDRDGRIDMASWNASLHDPDPRDPEAFYLGEFRLYHNEDTGSGRWVGLKLTGLGVVDDVVHSNVAAIGARAYVTTNDGITRMREVRAGESYLSHHSLEVEVGLGSATAIDEVRIRWATGIEEVFTDVAMDAYQELVEGSGVAQKYGVLIPKASGEWSDNKSVLSWYQAKWLQPDDILVERAVDPGEGEPAFEVVEATGFDVTDGLGRVIDPTAAGETAYVYRLTVESHGGKFRESTLVSLVTGERTDPVPSRPDLKQNFPNPFNPSTTISFELTRPGPARIRLYDLKGRRIRTLFDEPAPAGRTDLPFDGTDDEGNSLASGTYIYVLDANGESISRRLTLVR